MRSFDDLKSAKDSSELGIMDRKKNVNTCHLDKALMEAKSSALFETNDLDFLMKSLTNDNITGIGEADGDIR